MVAIYSCLPATLAFQTPISKNIYIKIFAKRPRIISKARNDQNLYTQKAKPGYPTRKNNDTSVGSCAPEAFSHELKRDPQPADPVSESCCCIYRYYVNVNIDKYDYNHNYIVVFLRVNFMSISIYFYSELLRLAMCPSPRALARWKAMTGPW